VCIAEKNFYRVVLTIILLFHDTCRRWNFEKYHHNHEFLSNITVTLPMPIEHLYQTD